MMFLGATLLVACQQRGDAPSAKAEPAAATPAPAPAPAPVAPAASAALPSPAPAATTTSPRPPEPRRPAAQSDDLVVRRLVVAHGVKDREPVEASESFESGHKVYAFVEVENRGREPGEVLVEFVPPGGGAPHGDVTLAVGAAPRWRTWAYTRTANTPGAWTAVVKNKKGDVLARASFEVR
jgi:hypothetical protein